MKNINILYSVVLIILALIIFKAWFISPIISAGDSWYYFPSMFSNAYFHPYAWYLTTMANGLGGPGYVNQNVSMVAYSVLFFARHIHLSWEMTSRFLLFIPYIFLSLSTSVFFIKKIFPENKFWIFTPIILTFNSYVLLMVGGGQIITALSFALMPLSIYLFIKLLSAVDGERKETAKYILLSFLVLALQTVLDLRIAFVTCLVVFVWLLIEEWAEKNSRVKKLAVFFIPFILLALVNLFWLIPVLFYGIDPIQQLGSAYSSTHAVKFLSFAKLENSIGLMHPYWPENIFGKIGFMKPEFLILPILAFSSFLFVRQDKKENKLILYFALIGLLGIFLGKGANEPFGNLYVFLFNKVPGFQLFRDSFKWYTLTAVSFSILIPFAVEKIYQWIKENKSLGKIYLQYIFLSIVFLSFIFIFRQAIFGQLNGTLKTRTLPNSYEALNNYLSQDKEFNRTLWIPQNTLFGYYSNIHPSISGRDFFQEYTPVKLSKKINSPSTQKELDLLGVKYVVIPVDSDSEIFLTDRKYDDKKYQQVVKNMDHISWLALDKTFGKIKVYKTLEYKKHFWCDCDAEINYKFVNPTHYVISIKNVKLDERLIFSEAFDGGWVLKDKNGNLQNSERFNKYFNSFVLNHDGEYDLIYSPQKLVDIGILISIITLVFSLGVLIVIFIKRK